MLIMSLLCAQMQGVFYFLDDISANIPGSIYGLSAQMGRDNEVITFDQRRVGFCIQAFVNQFFLHDIGGLAADLTLLQGFIHILLG